MNIDFSIQELSIVILGRNHNPTILNPDFLKLNDIVAADWELQEPPICIEPMAQVHFKNKVKITAQLERVIFLENISGKAEQEILIPEIANKYTNSLPHVEYLAIGINPKGQISMPGDEEACRNFLRETFITSGPWQTFGDSPVKTNIKFTYSFEDVNFTLEIEEKAFKLSEDKSIPVIVFAANIHHALPGDNRNTRLINLHKIIGEWEKDLNLYKELVNKILERKDD